MGVELVSRYVGGVEGFEGGCKAVFGGAGHMPVPPWCAEAANSRTVGALMACCRQSPVAVHPAA